jgi:hypothetical protein
MNLRQAQERPFGERAAVLSGLAARVLGWNPDEFWRATPAELASALEEPARGDGMMSGELERLREQFPDG